MTYTSETLDDLVSRFERCALPIAGWTHLAHLAVGLSHVHRFGRDDALVRMRAGIRRLNDSHGTPNSPTRGYHETITRAYLHLLSDFLVGAPPDTPLHESVARLVRSPLADRNVLFSFYSREVLLSATARAGWVEPDVAPLRWTVSG